MRLNKSDNAYLVLSLFPFILAAIFSEGFLHPDEHYQILEFLHLKISSWTIPSIFNWDYLEKIRPWFQVWVYYLLVKVLWIKNPFMIALSIRLLNGFLGWASLYFLCKKLSEKDLKRNLFFVSLIWFVPFFFVRTSSESLSTSLFFFGSAFFLSGSKKSSWISGLFWGMSFLCRYQMGIVIFAGNVWMLLKKKSLKFFFMHILGLAFVVGAGVLIDKWGYGVWNFSAWNYLRENVLHSRASQYGVSPFWFYFLKPVIKGGVVVPLFILSGLVLYLKKNKFDFWVVILLSFFIIHSLIPHKEVRFLVFCYVLAAVMAISIFEKKKTYLFSFVFLINSFFLVKSIFLPAGGDIALYRFVYERSIQKLSTPFVSIDRKFEFTMPFFQNTPVETVGIFLNQDALQENLVLTTKFSQYEELSRRGVCYPIFNQHPAFLRALNFTNWLERSGYFVVWDCKKSGHL